MVLSLENPADVDVPCWVEYLSSRGLISTSLPTVRLVRATATHTVVGIGNVVLKAARPGHPVPMSGIAQTMALAEPLAPAVLLADDQDRVLVTTFVAAPQWQHLLNMGRIDHRTFGMAGEMLTGVHDRGLAHGGFQPDNILVGRHNRLHVVGWTGVHDTELSLADESARFAAHLVAGSVRQPYAYDWYVEAARWFLSGAGVIEQSGLRERVAAALTDLPPEQSPEHRAALDARAHDLLDARIPPPW